MRRLTILFTAILIVVSAAGCVDGQVEMVNPYRADGDNVTYTTDRKVSNYDELERAVFSIISQGLETDTVKAVGYSGDVEADLTEICTNIAENTVIGNYALNYLSGSINKIVSYYEAKITVSYKIDRSQMRNIYFILSQDDLDSAAAELMENLKRSAVLYIGDKQLSIRETFEKMYLKYPVNSVYRPGLEISIIQAEGEGRLAEVGISYPKNGAEIISQRDALQRGISAYAELIDHTQQAERLYAAAVIMCDELSFEDTASAVSHSTAYGAINQKQADDEGLSLGFKALCDKIGVECVAVSGRREGKTHFWNIVKVDGYFYHVDISVCINSGYREYFLKCDEDFADEYTWDADSYPVCMRRHDFSYLYEE